MMKTTSKFPFEASYLRLILRYDAETGQFFWRDRPDAKRYNNARYSGRVAGTSKDGYVVIFIDRKGYRAHRLAWFYVTGEDPGEDVDHRDRDRANNRWGNLRSASRSENLANAGLRSDNISGCKGVSWHSQTQKWRSRINVGRRAIYLGLFETKEAASKAYATAAERYFGEFARTA